MHSWDEEDIDMGCARGECSLGGACPCYLSGRAHGQEEAEYSESEGQVAAAFSLARMQISRLFAERLGGPEEGPVAHVLLEIQRDILDVLGE